MQDLYYSKKLLNTYISLHYVSSLFSAYLQHANDTSAVNNSMTTTAVYIVCVRMKNFLLLCRGRARRSQMGQLVSKKSANM
jgi:hypothetical protein